MKDNSTSEWSAAEALAAADDARIRRRAFAVVQLIFGLALVGSSLLFWPRGVFQVISHGSAEAVPLVAIGAAFLLGGAAVSSMAARRLISLRNHSVSVGKAHDAFVNEPDLGVPTIGMGHGGPMDASVAKFANPGKLLPGPER